MARWKWLLAGLNECSWLGLSVLAAAATSGCSGADGTEDSATLSEMAMATVSGTVSGGADGRLAARPSFLERALTPVNVSWAANASCPTAATGIEGANCAIGGGGEDVGKVMTLRYASCDFGNRSAVWEGGVILTSSESVQCGQVPTEAPGSTLRRAFVPGTTRTIADSVHVASIDTSEPSGYETPVSGGTLVKHVSDTSRTIDIQGVHIVSQKVFRGTGNAGRIETQADHTVSTVAGHPIRVSVSGASRMVNGTVQVQHNLERYTGTSVFRDVRYVDGCCFPRSGTLTTTLEGSRTGEESLEFDASECGKARFTDGTGTSELTLTRCF